MYSCKEQLTLATTMLQQRDYNATTTLQQCFLCGLHPKPSSSVGLKSSSIIRTKHCVERNHAQTRLFVTQLQFHALTHLHVFRCYPNGMQQTKCCCWAKTLRKHSWLRSMSRTSLRGIVQTRKSWLNTTRWVC